MDFKLIKQELEKFKFNLEDLGYEFCHPDEVLPGPTQSVLVDELESMIGLIPETIKQFYLEVGSADFTGKHSDWDQDIYPDPFFMSSLDRILESAKKYVEDPEEAEWYQDNYGGFALELSPDYYHKENVSGGPPYHVVLPCEANPKILGMEDSPRFLEYIKSVLGYGGFPGLKFYDHNWPISKIT
ncbi:hypothetical protein ACVBEJ_11935 [Porticoccus sp. GXU_MW_L64]